MDSPEAIQVNLDLPVKPSARKIKHIPSFLQLLIPMVVKLYLDFIYRRRILRTYHNAVDFYSKLSCRKGCINGGEGLSEYVRYASGT
jgi:hypothetical protein